MQVRGERDPQYRQLFGASDVFREGAENCARGGAPHQTARTSAGRVWRGLAFWRRMNAGLPERQPSLLAFFRPAPAAPVTLTDPAEITATYRRWQKRVLIFSVAGYATFYFVRKNLGVAMPLMAQRLNLSKEDLGLILTLHGVVYGVSKFANGFLANRANARTFMAVALIASAVLNVFFGLNSALIALVLFWMLNGWFQGMGFPPCARLIANWFPPNRLATNFSIWNMSHNIGSILVVLLCGFLVSGSLFAANWRSCFFVPAAIAVGVAGVLWFMLPDTPPSVGLPEFAGTHVDLPENEARDDFKAFVFRQVFSNKYIWMLSLANFFVYTIRYAVFDWGPTMLLEAKNIQIMHAAWMIAGFEAFGLLGALLGGWVTDRLLGGQGGARLRDLHDAGRRFTFALVEVSRHNRNCSLPACYVPRGFSFMARNACWPLPARTWRPNAPPPRRLV